MFDGMFAGRDIANLSDYGDYLRAGSRRVWASWKSCDLVGQVVMGTPFTIQRKGSTTPVKNAELSQLLTAPNRFETYPELLYKSIFHLKLTGNAYWYKAEATLKGDRPKELFALNPKRVKVALNGQNEIIGYIYRSGGKEMTFDVEEIMHFKRPHPDNDFYGLGDIEAGEELINEALNHNNWAKAFWKNGAAPSGLLISKDKITDEREFEKAKAKWQQQYGGAKNAGKTAWLTGEWTYERIGLSNEDMQELDRIRLTMEQIFMLHGIPLSVAGVREAANYATAEIDDERFLRYTVLPMVQIIEATQNTDLVAGYGQNLEVKFNVSGLINLFKVTRDLVPLFDRGVLSLNELRAKAGFARIENDPMFDQHFINAGLVPLELSGIADLGQTDQAAQRSVSRFIEKTLANQAENPIP
jgi:HK97 family phage portal protein